jgi:hypothetical protein
MQTSIFGVPKLDFVNSLIRKIPRANPTIAGKVWKEDRREFLFKHSLYLQQVGNSM